MGGGSSSGNNCPDGYVMHPQMGCVGAPEEGHTNSANGCPEGSHMDSQWGCVGNSRSTWDVARSHKAREVLEEIRAVLESENEREIGHLYVKHKNRHNQGPRIPQGRYGTASNAGVFKTPGYQYGNTNPAIFDTLREDNQLVSQGDYATAGSHGMPHVQDANRARGANAKGRYAGGPTLSHEMHGTSSYSMSAGGIQTECDDPMDCEGEEGAPCRTDADCWSADMKCLRNICDYPINYKLDANGKLIVGGGGGGQQWSEEDSDDFVR